MGHISHQHGVKKDLFIGLASAVVVGVLGWLVVEREVTQEAADTSVRAFGTLLTVLFGILSAIWWNQSAKLSNRLVDEDAPDRQLEKHANALNSAAATFTALALISSVFDSLPWKSNGSSLCAVGVLLLLAMSGSEIRQAVPISLRQRLDLSGILGLLSLALVALLFLLQRIL